MKLQILTICSVAFASAVAQAGMKPVAFRLSSLPSGVEQGQKLVLCATNVGTGSVDVSLEFIKVGTGSVITEKTVALAPLGSGAAATPCLSLNVGPPSQSSGQPEGAPMSAAFAPDTSKDAAGNDLIVGVVLVRQPLLSFRQAQVTASIQVLASDEHGNPHTVAVIPLSRVVHPRDGAPVYVPPAQPPSTHH